MIFSVGVFLLEAFGCISVVGVHHYNHFGAYIHHFAAMSGLD